MNVNLKPSPPFFPSPCGKGGWGVRAIIILTLLSSILFFFKLGSFSLYDAAETIYGEMIKQIRLTGDWITMHYNGKIIFDKPPLYFWLATIATYIFGFNEFAVRLWAALCGVLTVLTTYFLGRSFYNERAGFLSAVVIMTAFQFLVQSRIAEIDILLTLLLSASFLFFWRRRYWPMYLCLALGMLTKGLIGAALPGFAILLFLLFKKEISRLKEMQIPLGIIIVLIVAGPWYVAEWWLHGAKFSEFIWGFLFLSRFEGVVCGHPGPWYYYFLAAILGFAPWSHFLPYALVRTWKNRLNEPELLTLCYIIPVFVVFSIAQTKLPNYILPLYPFFAIAAGKLWDDFLGSKQQSMHKGMTIANGLLAVVVALIIIGFVMLGTSRYAGQYQELLPDLQLLAGILIAGSMISIGMFVFQKFKVSFCLIPAMVFLIAFVLTTQTLPAVEKYKGIKELAQKVAQNIRPEEQISAYEMGNRPSVVFYNPKPIKFLSTKEEALSFLKNRKGYLFTATVEHEKIMPKSGKILDKKGDFVVLYTP